MDIYGDQIVTQFKTYGAPAVVTAFFDEMAIDVPNLSIADLPAHGVAAVKELMAYTTGAQVVMAIAAVALGQMPEPVAVQHDSNEALLTDDGSDLELDDDGDADVLDAKGNTIVEGARVVVCTADEDGGAIEGGGTTGEVESIERRGARNYVSIETDPDPGHTTGNLISVLDSHLEVIDA